MTADELRRWLGIYFLVLTAALGAYVILFASTSLLPLDEREATGSVQIILPVLVGQVALIYRWYATNKPPKGQKVHIPVFLVKAPPLIVTVILVATIVLMAVGNAQGQSWTPSGGRFRAIVTLCVTLLNATTILITGKFFESRNETK